MVIKGYEIERLLAEGGMASVYLAVQQSLRRPVALKVLKRFDKPADASRFLTEGRLIASLDHPNIITIHDIGVADDRHYISMEYLEGGSLEHRIREGMSADQALDIAITIGDCLEFVHRKGIIHLDVKPANILFHTNGTVKLTDFGIARAMAGEGEPGEASIALGSPYYISPEQAQGQALDGRADIYSLGIALYEMLTGRKPYEEESHMETIVAHVTRSVPVLPGELAVLQEALAKMIAKEPEDRFASAAEMVGYLKAMRWVMGAANARAGLKGAPGSGPAVAATQRFGRLQEGVWRGYRPLLQRRLTRWAAAAGACLLVFLGLRHTLSGTGVMTTGPLEKAQPGAEGYLFPKTNLQAPNSPNHSGMPSLGRMPSLERQPQAPIGPLIAPGAAPLPGGAGGEDSGAVARSLVPAAAPQRAHEIGAGVAVPAEAPESGLQSGAGEVAERSARLTQSDAPVGEGVPSIGALLAKAQAALEDYRLTVPGNNNALYFYSQVLAQDPNRQEALEGLDKIADRYAGLVRAEIDRGNDEKARKYLQRGLRIRESHAELLLQKAELQAREQQWEAQRIAELRAQREARLRAQQEADAQQQKKTESEGLFQRIRSFFGKPRSIPTTEDGN